MKRRAPFAACAGLVLTVVPFFTSVPSLLSLPAPPAFTATEQSRAPSAPRNLFEARNLGLLETPDRDEWQKTDLIMDELQIADGSRVADLGTGGGWFSIRIARRVGPNGIVYAEDIQPLMIEATSRRVQREGLKNVVPVLGTDSDPKIPEKGTLDAVVIVGSFHEMNARPETVRALLNHVARSLKPGGRLGVVDFLPGAGGPGPAPEERVDPERVIEAAASARFKLQKREEIPPFCFLLVFGRDSDLGAAR